MPKENNYKAKPDFDKPITKSSTKSSSSGFTIGPPKLTRFERARIIGTRSLQISLGAPIFLKSHDTFNPIKIATDELSTGSLPLSIRRCLPSGNCENISLSDLI